MIKALKRYQANFLPAKLKKILATYTYTFNPSYCFFNDTHYLAMRTYLADEGEIKGKIFIWKNDIDIHTLDLSSYFKKKLGVNKVADPKLFLMNNRVFGTFNTGREFNKFNKLFLFSLTKEGVYEHFTCKFDERANIEKNWAFYYYKNDLYALYSLNPLTIIKACNIGKDFIRFEIYYQDKKQSLVNHSIGTQLLNFEGEILGISHKKVSFKGSRMYLGRPIKFSLSNEPRIELGKKWFLIHSIKSLFGDRHKFNNQLISCTYFSGLSKLKDEIIVSYGINDVEYNIIKVDKNKLWE
ncbi:hypothetical protein [Winogradskyella sp.]|uniref:hypothetical protein n=1 Tax=Winogradskyella sp. TaxID=1883156 RepID=UPI003F6C7BCE